MFYLSFAIAILSSMLYHVFQKAISPDAHPVMSLLATYLVACVLTIALFAFFPLKTGPIRAIKDLNWASIALAVAIVGLEMGFLLAYRSGWDIGLAGVAVNVAGALLLVPTGVVLFKEQPSLINLIGVGVCILGLLLVNARGG